MKVLPELAREVGATRVFWNRCYEPWQIKRDSELRAALKSDDIAVRSYNGSLLFEPPNVLKADRTPYKVFTPFHRKGCLTAADAPREPLRRPVDLPILDGPAGHELADLNLLRDIPWYEEMATLWQPGEAGA